MNENIWFAHITADGEDVTLDQVAELLADEALPIVGAEAEDTDPGFSTFMLSVTDEANTELARALDAAEVYDVTWTATDRRGRLVEVYFPMP